MEKLWKVVRALVSAILLIAVGVPAVLYVLLSLDGVQNQARTIASRELSHILGAEMTIGSLSYRPFNRLMLSDLSLVNSTGTDTIAKIRRVSAGVEIWRLLRHGEIVIDYALIDGGKFNIWRNDSTSPLNIQPIIEHLKSDTPRERETPFDLSINTVILRRSSLCYDINSSPEPIEGRFDPSHIAISDLAVNAYIPRLSNHEYRVDLDHLSAKERSGFAIDRLSLKGEFIDSTLTVKNLELNVGQTHIAFEPLSADLGKNIAATLANQVLSLKTQSGCRVYPPDFKAFVPALEHFNALMDLNLNVEGNTQAVNLRKFTLRHQDSGTLGLSVTGTVEGLDSIPGLRYHTENVTAVFDGAELAQLLRGFISNKNAQAIKRLPLVGLNIQAEGTPKSGHFNLRSDGDAGLIAADGNYSINGRTEISGNIDLDAFNVGLIAGYADLGNISGKISGNAILGRRPQANVLAEISNIEWRGYNYSDLSVNFDMPEADKMEATVNINDPNATAKVYAFYKKDGNTPLLNATAALANVNLTELGLPNPKPGYNYGVKLIAEMKGTGIDDLEGSVDIHDLRCLDERNQGLRIPRINITATPYEHVPSISIQSELLNGSINGRYSLSALVPQLKDMVAEYVPVLFPNTGATSHSDALNDFSYNFNIADTQELSTFFELPAAVINSASLSGHINSETGMASMQLDAPYILKGNKLYEGNYIFSRLDREMQDSKVFVCTEFPTNKGKMLITGLVKAFDNRIDTHVDWQIQRSIPLNGAIDFSTLITALNEKTPGSLSPVDALINFNPGTINFGYETWTIPSSSIELNKDRLQLKDFALSAGEQHISIDGSISSSPEDTVTIDLNSIHLLPIFETLEIDKAMLSGKATGTFKASQLLTDERSLECPDLHVDSIGYNRCTIGDAEILARWDREKQSFYLDADIIGDTGKESHIRGDIFPFSESLDLDFRAQSVPVAFLKPFMEAFARDISGRASGQCRLFGTFKEIDLTGDVFAENVSMAVDFTNTVYHTTDSVHMRPGEIIIPSATIYDAEGHSAKLKGWVGHTFFKAPVFDFKVTEAENFLSYNVSPAQNSDWYGTIYGNGSASVSGEPGVVNIDVDMTTSPRSTFTFVLSDRLDAVDYSFINFRDVTPDSLKHIEKVNDDVPTIVRDIQSRLAKQEEDEPSAYKMKISVNITPEAHLTLVMDPTAGDDIKATGSGHMTMTYNSVNEDLRIYGEYAVQSGNYHFTLQDIIIKDFIIEQGSTINFDGDPYAVRADLQAYYATNANLSDLDESFLHDRDVARTNVPVHALMKVVGDIRQPDITFDLKFPTLTSDTYRKVKSIVSTNDMMNRQIIYLLALNRFYTPDYMKTTKGSELFSVASSTLSSQLSSLLGKLSDNWSIAPNVRSDQGDFSDIEVDVALSSRLLNNRLLFNGNFGYRDKSLNSNQFVGDFDIEYILNKRGTWRLKAYNRYNDANYYLRSAATTQGVGIMFRHDVDKLFNWLHPHKKDKTNEETDSKTEK